MQLAAHLTLVRQPISVKIDPRSLNAERTRRECRRVRRGVSPASFRVRVLVPATSCLNYGIPSVIPGCYRKNGMRTTNYCLMETLKYFAGAFLAKILSSRMGFAVTGEQVVGPDILTVRRLPFGASGGGAGMELQFQSSGGSTIPQTFPWLYSDTPIRKSLPSLPSGRQFATWPDALPPPGRSLNSTGVLIGKACDARIPQPCGLTTSATHCADSGCLRSMLVTTRGICTRNRCCAVSSWV